MGEINMRLSLKRGTNMKKIVTAFICAMLSMAVLLPISCGECGGSTNVARTWYSDGIGLNGGTLVLHDNGRYTGSFDGGSYSVKDNQLILISIWGDKYTLEVKKDTLYYEDGGSSCTYFKTQKAAEEERLQLSDKFNNLLKTNPKYVLTNGKWDGNGQVFSDTEYTYVGTHQYTITDTKMVDGVCTITFTRTDSYYYKDDVVATGCHMTIVYEALNKRYVLKSSDLTGESPFEQILRKSVDANFLPN
jgi:hypothetical protein